MLLMSKCLRVYLFFFYVYNELKWYIYSFGITREYQHYFNSIDTANIKSQNIDNYYVDIDKNVDMHFMFEV